MYNYIHRSVEEVDWMTLRDQKKFPWVVILLSTYENKNCFNVGYTGLFSHEVAYLCMMLTQRRFERRIVVQWTKKRREPWTICWISWRSNSKFHLYILFTLMPKTVAAQSKTQKFFAHVNSKITGSNPIWGTNVVSKFYLYLRQADPPPKVS
jgi:hypothetical protein